ncbi:MAG: helix-turn-helix domain-containing protein [Clostridia bacterium]|nr:helix-turn-helix domain-containing protein [Clostridia bacterium]MBQ4340963.1 helix-turn-helix domain-containing protein [Clostridia bacterium]
MELGRKIKQLRFKAGLTQEQLAEKLGVGAQSVSKWENAVAMPDISALPLIAETFGVSIDDLFDLTNEQRLNRIENRLDAEDELPRDVFAEYEEFLKAQLGDKQNSRRATELIAYLYWHRMEQYGRKASRFAKDAIRRTPGEKHCQWILSKTDGYAAWDWNMHNHTDAVEFFGEVVKANPDTLSPYYYLLDNLIADHRTQEAEAVLKRMSALKDANPVITETYRAHIVLARFDEPAADAMIEKLLKENADDWVCLFEAAQYFAGKADYDRAIELYELSFEKTDRRPRFQDELMAIRDIYKIRGDWKKAAQTQGRIVSLLENEWGMTEEDEVKNAKAEQARLMEKANA